MAQRTFPAILLASIGLLLAAIYLLPVAFGAPQAAATNGCWTSVPADMGIDVENARLLGVEVVDPNDVWAVGVYGSRADKTLIEHWNGVRWTQFTSPNPGNVNSLSSIAALTPNDIWAVGTDGYDTLILHWDGRVWNRVPSPTKGNGTRLFDVDVTASNDAWAVGDYLSSNDDKSGSLLLHWDGSAWSEVLLDEAAVFERFNRVEAVTTSNVWIGGDNIWHWNGRELQLAYRSLYPGNAFSALAAVGPNDAWAGNSNGTIDNEKWVHWNGNRWSEFVQPLDDTPKSIRDMTALASDDIWAVGDRIWHWDGDDWQRTIDIRTAEAPGAILNGVAAKGEEVWTVGYISDNNFSSSGPLIMRYSNTPCASATPAATSSPAATTTPIELITAPPVPGDNSRTFPETGQTIKGLFLNYWDAHGGLAQQGYPISAMLWETSELNGKVYTVQYFERAVFEYHPENQAPYNVLLSQLGRFQYDEKYPQGATNQQPSNTDPRLFPETGKTLGGRFRQYWEQNGGLAQQGYPISDEFEETSDLNGKTYRVQYFERAVFEYHPENTAPYDVLLSQLGKFQYRKKYESGGASPALAARSATPIARGTLQTAAGDYVFYSRPNGNDQALYGYNVRNRQEVVISDRPGTKTNAASDGKVVAWIEGAERSEGIEGYDLAAGRLFTIAAPGQYQEFTSIDFDQGMLYFFAYNVADNRTGLFTYDLATTSTTRLEAQAPNPKVDNGVLVWSNQECNGQPGGCETSIHMSKLDGSSGGKVLATSPIGDSGYDIVGDNIVWSFYPPSKVYLHNISSGTTKTIYDGQASRPHIGGDWVIWQNEPEENGTALRGYNLKTGQLSDLLAPMPDLSITKAVILEPSTLVFSLNGTAGEVEIFSMSLE